MAELRSRRLYLCTPHRADLADFVAACIAGGVDVVQLRDKELDARAILKTAATLRKVCEANDVPFILNDRPDLALEAGADGVHLGQDDAPPALARQLLGPDAIIGWSTHAATDLAASIHEPIDYVSAGPVTPTPTKPGRPGVGLEYIRHAVAHTDLPVWVTGGAAPDTVGEFVRAGARHVVVVRWLTTATNPTDAARALRRALDDEIRAVDDEARALDEIRALDKVRPSDDRGPQTT